MPMPNTGGQLRTKIQDMQIGDFIVWAIKDSYAQFGISTTGLVEIPLAGLHWNNSLTNTFGYGIKVDKGLIVMDRVRQHTTSWTNLKSGKLIQGSPVTVKNNGTDFAGILRSLGGGCAFADENGRMSTANKKLGAWPTNNEWERYIVQKDYGTGAGRDDVWHWSNVRTWTQDVMANGVLNLSNPAAYRLARGLSAVYDIALNPTETSNSLLGFRPVFEYKE